MIVWLLCLPQKLINYLLQLTCCATCVLDFDCFRLLLCEQFICLFVVGVSFVKCQFVVLVNISCRITGCCVCVLNVWKT